MANQPCPTTQPLSPQTNTTPTKTHTASKDRGVRQVYHQIGTKTCEVLPNKTPARTLMLDGRHRGQFLQARRGLERHLAKNQTIYHQRNLSNGSRNDQPRWTGPSSVKTQNPLPEGFDQVGSIHGRLPSCAHLHGSTIEPSGNLSLTAPLQGFRLWFF